MAVAIGASAAMEAGSTICAPLFERTTAHDCLLCFAAGVKNVAVKGSVLRIPKP